MTTAIIDYGSGNLRSAAKAFERAAAEHGLGETILVTSRPSEDLLAVYDAHLWPSGNFLWRVMGRDGLETGETPLVTQFEKGFEGVQKRK